MRPLNHYHASLRSGDRQYDLSHLDPFQFEVSSAKVPRPLRINVRFTSHCFSEAFDRSRHSGDELVLWDGGRRRVFCPRRYALSLHLPGLIRGLAAVGTRVNETASRRNWMYAVTVEVPTTPELYRIFFDLRRTVQELRRLQDLDMIVESAYPADAYRSEPNVLGRVGFALLAGTLFTGKPVTTRR